MGRPALAGVGLGAAGLLKTWPAGSVLWAGRRNHVPGRARTLAGFGVTIGVGALLSVAVVGPAVLGEWLRATVGASNQPLVSFSVWGLGRHLFGSGGSVGLFSGSLTPVADMPALAGALTAAALVVVVAALVLVLRRPGDQQLALWHTATAVVLLLPVSHYAYRLLVVPLLWNWLALLLRDPRLWRAVVWPLAAWVSWWILVVRVIWPDRLATASFAIMMLVTLAALGVSVRAAAGLGTVVDGPFPLEVRRVAGEGDRR